MVQNTLRWLISVSIQNINKNKNFWTWKYSLNDYLRANKCFKMRGKKGDKKRKIV